MRVRLASGATWLRFRVEGGALGYTPIIIGGLSSSDAGMLWISDEDGGYSLLAQGENGEPFWQVNYNRAAGDFEFVFNVELYGSQEQFYFAFGPTDEGDLALER